MNDIEPIEVYVTHARRFFLEQVEEKLRWNELTQVHFENSCYDIGGN